MTIIKNFWGYSIWVLHWPVTLDKRVRVSLLPPLSEAIPSVVKTDDESQQIHCPGERPLLMKI